jgi:hypothetical protein
MGVGRVMKHPYREIAQDTCLLFEKIQELVPVI